MVYAGPTAGVATYEQTISKSVAADPKGAANQFFNELTRLLADYADPDKDLEWMGMTVPASEKYEVVGTIIMSEARQQLTQKLEAPFAYYLNPMLQAEKNISDLVSSL